MKNLYTPFKSFVNNYFNNFVAFTLVIKTFFLSSFSHFAAFISSFGRFFNNFEFIILIAALQVLFYFHFLSNSYLDFTNEAIWFFSLFTVLLVLLGHFNSSSDNSLSSTEIKIKQIEDQLSLNFQINQQISGYNEGFVNFNNAVCFQAVSLHTIFLYFLNSFSNSDNLFAQFNFILNESFLKQFSYIIRSADSREDHLLLVAADELLHGIVSEQ